MAALNEELLNSWLDLSLAVINERLVSHIPYNESLICNILNRHAKENNPHPMTATRLCDMTRMQKSQMNRTLSAMEKRGLIYRERSLEDRRQIFVYLNPAADSLYFKQHQKMLSLVDRIIERMGEDKAKDVAETLRFVASTAENIIK